MAILCDNPPCQTTLERGARFCKPCQEWLDNNYTAILDTQALNNRNQIMKAFYANKEQDMIAAMRTPGA